MFILEYNDSILSYKNKGNSQQCLGTYSPNGLGILCHREIIVSSTFQVWTFPVYIFQYENTGTRHKRAGEPIVRPNSTRVSYSIGLNCPCSAKLENPSSVFSYKVYVLYYSTYITQINRRWNYSAEKRINVYIQTTTGRLKNNTRAINSKFYRKRWDHLRS